MINQFYLELEQQPSFKRYQQAADLLLKDAQASELLRDLISSYQLPPENPSELVTIEQEVERCEILQQYLQAETEMLRDYHRLAKQRGFTVFRCGGLAEHSGCEQCHNGCSTDL